MMKKLAILSLLYFSCAPVGAEIYKITLPDGSVTYSDQPADQAKKLVPPATQTYTPQAAPLKQARPAATQQSQPQPYQLITIDQPKHNATIRDNNGNLSVQLHASPPLQTDFGHRLVLLMDGQSLNDDTGKPNYQLNNIDRGTHTLKATIQDANDNTLIESATVQFHMKRSSALFRK